MAKDVVMPALGMAQETGTLLRWLKSPGDAVVKGELLMEVETDKAMVEVEATASGILSDVTAQPGDVVPVGQVIARIVSPDEPRVPAKDTGGDVAAGGVHPTQRLYKDVRISPIAARIAQEHGIDPGKIKTTRGVIEKEDVLAYLAAQQSSPDTLSGAPSPFSPLPKGEGEGAASLAESAGPVAPTTGSGRVLASPKARRLAKEKGVDIGQIRGNGPMGAVLAADVIAFQSRAVPSERLLEGPPQSESLAVSKVWRVMVQRLSHAWTTIPHFYLARDVNAGRLMAWRDAKKAEIAKLTYTDLLVRLTATALQQHPRVNASWVNDNLVLHHDINIGLAVAVEQGLTVPVIHGANELSLAQLAARRTELIEQANAGRLSLKDVSDGTFTISNLGMYGVDAFNAIVNPPQAAILAVSRIAERVVPVNHQPAVQPMMTLTLSCDHRVVDGARAAQFLDTLAQLIEEPLILLD